MRLLFLRDFEQSLSDEMRSSSLALAWCCLGVASGFVGPALKPVRPLLAPGASMFCSRTGHGPAVVNMPLSRNLRRPAVSALRAQLRPNDNQPESEKDIPTVNGIDMPSFSALAMLPVGSLQQFVTNRSRFLLHHPRPSDRAKRAPRGCCV
jgi:hypothetical protein